MGSALGVREEVAAAQREMAASGGSAGALGDAMAVAVARARAVLLRVRWRVAVGVAPTAEGAEEAEGTEEVEEAKAALQRTAKRSWRHSRRH